MCLTNVTEKSARDYLTYYKGDESICINQILN